MIRPWLALVFIPAAFAAPPPKVTVDAAGFEKNVKPILKNTCSGCHNASVASGGVNLLPYLDASTVLDDRASWEKILQKIEAGEMPPKSVPAPAQLSVLVSFVRGELEKADAAAKPDSGRVTAKR